MTRAAPTSGYQFWVVAGSLWLVTCSHFHGQTSRCITAFLTNVYPWTWWCLMWNTQNRNFACKIILSKQTGAIWKRESWATKSGRERKQQSWRYHEEETPTERLQQEHPWKTQSLVLACRQGQCKSNDVWSDKHNRPLQPLTFDASIDVQGESGRIYIAWSVHTPTCTWESTLRAWGDAQESWKVAWTRWIVYIEIVWRSFMNIHSQTCISSCGPRVWLCNYAPSGATAKFPQPPYFNLPFWNDVTEITPRN